MLCYRNYIYEHKPFFYYFYYTTRQLFFFKKKYFHNHYFLYFISYITYFKITFFDYHPHIFKFSIN